MRILIRYSKVVVCRRCFMCIAPLEGNSNVSIIKTYPYKDGAMAGFGVDHVQVSSFPVRRPVNVYIHTYIYIYNCVPRLPQ